MMAKESNQHIAIIGPAHPFRGGIAAFNERLASELQQHGHTVKIYTFSYQYPSFLFPGKTQYSSEPAPPSLEIEQCIHSVNPFNWVKVGNRIRKSKPGIVIVRYWLPFMGPCLGTILRRIKKDKNIKIICIADNITPHEKRIGDKTFTQYFVRPVDAFIVMSREVLKQLEAFNTNKLVRLIPHPLYDHFGDIVSSEDARRRLGINQNERVLLFFGFIRKYKGLDLLLEAMKLLIQKPENANLKLLIAGEFYDDKKKYASFFEDKELAEHVIIHDQFIPDSEIRYYFCAADVTVQPYKSATQSGVTPLSYHFEIPMIVTDVGSLADMVPDGVAGLVAAPSPESLAEKIEQYFEEGKEHFTEGLKQQKALYSWSNMSEGILQLADVS